MERLKLIIVTMFRWFVPRKFESLSEFVEAVKASKRDFVKIEVEVRTISGVNSLVVGTIGTFVYYLKFSSGKLTYFEETTARKGSSMGMSDVNDRVKASVQTYLKAELRMQEILNANNGMRVVLIDPKGKMMQTDDFRSLHIVADKLDLAVLV